MNELLLKPFIAMQNLNAFFAQAGESEPSPFAGIVGLLIVIVVLAGMWKAFAKAGQPGWACIIPFYNAYVLCKIAGRPGWWFLLMFIPMVNLVIIIIVSIDVAKRFGQGAGFGIGLALLGFIFWPILGFGSAQYR